MKLTIVARKMIDFFTDSESTWLLMIYSIFTRVRSYRKRSIVAISVPELTNPQFVALKNFKSFYAALCVWWIIFHSATALLQTKSHKPMATYMEKDLSALVPQFQTFTFKTYHTNYIETDNRHSFGKKGDHLNCFFPRTISFLKKSPEKMLPWLLQY